MNAHFCFSELLILREKKRFADFLLGRWSTKKNFQKILKRHHTGQWHKKGTILYQALQITLFLTHPECAFFPKGLSNFDFFCLKL